MFFTLSSIFLVFVEKRQADKNQGKNWWILYFENPKDNSLDFTIENHSNKSNFHWEILGGGNKIKEGDVEIEKGADWTSDVQNIDPEEKIIIRVSNGENKKEIYKIIP